MDRVPRILSTSLVLAILSTSVLGQVTYKRIDGNLQGDVLVLSVNKFAYVDEGAEVKSADACEQQCSFTSGCQGWTYCSSAAGCGTGCRAYHTKMQPGRVGFASLSCTPDAGKYMPILYDAWVTPANPDSSTFKPNLTDLCSGDAWPQHTCTLKNKVNAQKLYAGPQAGWVSGTVTLAATCAPTTKDADPITAAECTACLGSVDPTNCLSCAAALYGPQACGYSRKVFVARSKQSYIKWMRERGCLACICLNKPTDYPARYECFEATEGIGNFKANIGTNYRTILANAAAKCPPA